MLIRLFAGCCVLVLGAGCATTEAENWEYPYADVSNGETVCPLPESKDDPISVSYKVWFVGPLDKSQFCSALVGVENTYRDNQLWLQLFEDETDCADPNQYATLTNKPAINAVEAFATALHVDAMTWDGVSTFVDNAEAASYFSAKKINVYVLDEDLLQDFRGMHVRDIREDVSSGVKTPKANLIFVPANTVPDTVAHEFGHAMTLGHVNFWSLPNTSNTADNQEKKQIEYCAEYTYWNNDCDYDHSATNIMWAAREVRSKYTIGQKERMVCNDWSALNVNGDRPESAFKFKCPDWSVVDLNTANGEWEKRIDCPPLPDPAN